MSAGVRICMTCRCFNPAGTYRVVQEGSDGKLRHIAHKVKGECRAKSPSIDPDGGCLLTSGVWPTIAADEWCAEWTARQVGARR